MVNEEEQKSILRSLPRKLYSKCVDCKDCTECRLCNNCYNCTNCYNCRFCKECEMCYGIDAKNKTYNTI